MKVTYEFNLREFKAWSGAVETLNKIESFDIEHPGAMDKAQEYIEECLGSEATETQINDMLWFEDVDILRLSVTTKSLLRTKKMMTVSRRRACDDLR